MYKCPKLNCCDILTEKKNILKKPFFIAECIHICSIHVLLVSMNQHFMTECFECICSPIMDSQVGMYKHLQKDN